MKTCQVTISFPGTGPTMFVVCGKVLPCYEHSPRPMMFTRTCGCTVVAGHACPHFVAAPPKPSLAPVAMADLDWKYAIKLPPPPTILELISKFGLTRSEHRRVFADHDPGDEDSRARDRVRWVCGRRLRVLGSWTDPACELDPNHYGPHDWETPPVPDLPPMFVYRRGMGDE